MKKLTLASLITAMFVLPTVAVAGDMEHVNKDKISSTFSELDNDKDGFISKEEADDDDIWEHFSSIDGILGKTADGNISQSEFDTYMNRNTGLVATSKEVSESAKDSKIKDIDPIEGDFQSFDEDDNGYISVAEAAKNKLKEHFGYADSNTDKRVSSDEFDSYMNQSKDYTSKNLDTNDMEKSSDVPAWGKNPKVTIQDPKMGSKERVEHDFATFDEDNNGYLSLEEASAHNMKKHFIVADVDHDQQISRIEFENYMKSMSKDETTVLNQH